MSAFKVYCLTASIVLDVIQLMLVITLLVTMKRLGHLEKNKLLVWPGNSVGCSY